MYNYGNHEFNYQSWLWRWDTLFLLFSCHGITLFEKKYDIKLIILISMYHLKPLVSLSRFISWQGALSSKAMRVAQVNGWDMFACFNVP